MAEPEPVGYCPYCGYRVSPGVCAECGREVSADTIARSPRTAQVARFLSSPLKIVLLLVVLLATAYLTRGGWLRFVPTRALMPFASPTRNKANIELEQRFFENRLSEDQINSMIMQSARLCLMPGNDYPTGSRVLVLANFQSALPAGLKLERGSCSAIVDGKDVQLREFARPERELEEWVYEFPPLPVGDHAIQVTQNVSPVHGLTLEDTPPSLPTSSVVLTAQALIKVEGKLSHSLDSDQYALASKEVATKVKAQVGYTDILEKLVFTIHGNQLPLTVAGMLLIQDHTGAYTVIKEWVAFQSGSDNRIICSHTCSSESALAGVNFYLVPDAAIAAAVDDKAGFPGIIAWENEIGIDTNRASLSNRYGRIAPGLQNQEPWSNISRIINPGTEEYSSLIRACRAAQRRATSGPTPASQPAP